MLEIKGIVTGVDGILIPPDRNLPSPRVIQAAHSLEIPLIPVTDRSAENMHQIIGLLNLRNIAVLDSGATLWDCLASKKRSWHGAESKDLGVVAVESALLLSGLDKHVLPLLAIGNSSRDISLFEAIGERGAKIAMSSAPQTLREAADIVVQNDAQNGFVGALQALNLTPY
jgi:hydroxymethylpyrimidine pyrophosphatase-like HAD family hydrolase